MTDDQHGHEHDEHDHEHPHDEETADDVRPRVRAMQSLLTEKGIVSTDAIDEAIAAYEHDIGPLNGARVVARAWSDPDFKRRLLEDANDAIEAFDFEVGVQHIEVKENTESVHNAVVCTLCSCYPWSLLGLPPTWYKTPAYRSRMVREPRSVLSEFGLELEDGVDVDVWDSSSEVRYMVLPQRPPGTDDLEEAELAELVTRDSLLGVEHPDSPTVADGGRPTTTGGRLTIDDGELSIDASGPESALVAGEEGPTFAAPWHARAFGIAVALHDDGAGFEWSAFQQRLIDEVEATDPDAYVGAVDASDTTDASENAEATARETYYEQWCAALERLLVEDGLLDSAAIDARAAEFADGDRTAEEFVDGDRGH